MRDTTCEIRGAINRINDPDTGRGGTTGFFAHEPILRKGCGDSASDMPLHRAIGFGQKILRAFAFCLACVAVLKPFQRKCRRTGDQIAAEVCARCQFTGVKWRMVLGQRHNP